MLPVSPRSRFVDTEPRYIVYWLYALMRRVFWRESGCDCLPSFIVGENMTAPMRESFDRGLSPDRRAELEQLLSVKFAGSPHNGFYDWRGTWVVLNKLEDGRYRVYAGTDWTVGDDGQLHNPTCLLYVSALYEPYFGKFDKLYYPTGEPYR